MSNNIRVNQTNYTIQWMNCARNRFCTWFGTIKANTSTAPTIHQSFIRISRERIRLEDELIGSFFFFRRPLSLSLCAFDSRDTHPPPKCLYNVRHSQNYLTICQANCWGHKLVPGDYCHSNSLGKRTYFERIFIYLFLI